MPNLGLTTVELISTLRTAPLNGSPSSSDYNETQRENLSDLASLAGFINSVVLSCLNALSPAALPAGASPVGIEGRTIFSDTADSSQLFFNSLTSVPLSIADSLRLLNGLLINFRGRLTDQGIQIDTLQAQLSSTNQNDIALALQALRDSLAQLSANQTSQGQLLTQVQNTELNRQSVRVASGAVTGSATHPTYFPVTVNWPQAFIDNNYTASVALEDATGFLYLASFSLLANGVGLTVLLGNYDSSSHSGTVHAIGIHD